jgi:hypothetical protein
MVSLLKSDQSLKTAIGADSELRMPIWHCITCKAFLMHVSSALDAIKKQGTFKAYKEAHEACLEQKEVAKQAMAALALFMASTSKGKKASKKASRKEPAKKSSEKEKAPKKTKEGSALEKDQPQNFTTSTRPSTTRPLSQMRPPRTSAKLLRPRCFSSMQTCYLQMSSTHGTR